MRADALSGTPMDEDLIEPGGSGGLSPSCQPLLDPEQDETDQDKCTPYASASSLATPIVKPEEETPPSSPALPERDGGDKSKVERAAAHVPVSPLERAAIAMSRRRAMTRMKPSAPYVALSCLQALVGAVVTATGGAAFATTPTFPAGCFWAGLLILAQGVYNLTLLCLKLTLHKNRSFRRCKRAMYHLLVVMCVVCILTTITAAFMDSLAAYMLHRTDFDRCLHTGDESLAIDCDSTTCSYLSLPPNTCYCCYLYHHRKANGCHTPFLLDKQTYFEGVASCSVLPDRLNPLLTTTGLLCLVSTIFNLIFIFKSRPVRYYVKNDKGEEEEVEEEESDGDSNDNRGLLGRVTNKLKAKRDKGGKRANVLYTPAQTEEDTVK